MRIVTFLTELVDNQHAQRQDENKRKETPDNKVNVAPEALHDTVPTGVVVAEPLLFVLRISQAVDRPEVMEGYDACHGQKEDANVLGARDRAKIRDLQGKPDGEELVRRHDDEYPNVGVAENVDEKIE
jgi:hypothetical protein